MIESILDSGIELIQWLEAHRSPPLDLFFSFITDAGAAGGYIVLLVLIWWGASWKLAARLFVALVVSVYVNATLKDFFELPRPFLYADLASLRQPEEYSFPSGHAQHAALIWGLLAWHVRKRWFTGLALTIMFLIGFSRVYLGVHFPSDVLTGWTVGGILAFLTARYSAQLVETARELSLSTQVAASLLVPATLTWLHPTKNTSMALGGAAGALAGLAIAQHRGLYPDGPGVNLRRGWLTLGLLGLPLLYWTLRQLSPGSDSFYYFLYNWSRFAAIGLWVSYLVPSAVALIRGRQPT